jgi:DNA-binding FrmR family transcriptional regulator
MTKEKQQILVAFKKAKSLTEKIITMTSEDHYCIDIMQQNLAVIGLLKSAHQKLMANHLNSCVINALSSKNNQTKKNIVDEILKVNKLASK